MLRDKERGRVMNGRNLVMVLAMALLVLPLVGCGGDDKKDEEGYKPYDPRDYGYEEPVYDRTGYGPDGFNKDGFDRQGYSRNGYDKDGFNHHGFDKDGYDKKRIHS